MMRQFELVERVQAYNPQTNVDLLNKAYVYAMQKHGTQLRASGDPYFAHPLEVAAILTDLKLDDATIAVALLHDTIEDTDATRAEIDTLFGPDIGAIVEGLTKIDRLNLVSRQKAEAENLRKLLLAISLDVRVLLVKLADRLHNMRTLDFMKPEARTRIARETMDIYAPLAGRMGMQDMRSELEDLAFRTLQREHFEAISKRLSTYREETEATVAEITGELAGHLEKVGVKALVQSRLKRIYSVFRKMERKSIGLEQLSDIIGFRIIVDDVDECYRALGVVHTTWSVVPGRFKDYISTPKHNDYRSVHTTVVGPRRQRVELQIRTRQMHEVAEFGIAAHALYKEAISGDMSRLEAESRAYGWLRTTIGHLTEGDNPEEFLEHTKLQLFQDQVFCFTPGGGLIALPRGATPIDFAYAVHTEIGDTCVGCKINGTSVPLITILRNGDEVEILRAPGHTPPPNWESIAVTGRARSAIRRAIRHAASERAFDLGQQIFAAIIEREALKVSEAELARLCEKLGQPSARDLMVALGDTAIDADELVRQLWAIKGTVRRRRRRRSPLLPVGTRADGWFGLAQAETFKFRVPGGQVPSLRAKSPLPLISFDTPVHLAPEGVLPGDRLVGILDANSELTIYPIESEALDGFHEPGNFWLDVRWDIANGTANRLHHSVIALLSTNRRGALAHVSAAIAACEANIHNVLVRAISPDFHAMLFELEVRDLAQLNDVLSTLRRTAGLSNVRRAKSAEAVAFKVVEMAPEFAASVQNEHGA
jgi:GTP diphosphokinase / guanosine-3',5'-bis(diphosphate) 3'-diphosphatase